MRERELTVVEMEDEMGSRFCCRYLLLIRELLPPIAGESYGLGIEKLQTGEAVRIPDITFSADRIVALANLVIRGRVTPCTLWEVVEDWL